jgi:hypothetical protein
MRECKGRDFGCGRWVPPSTRAEPGEETQGAEMARFRLAAFATAILSMTHASMPAAALRAAPEAAHSAIEAVDLLERAGCWQYGWHGWGWYSFCLAQPRNWRNLREHRRTR